VRIALLLTRPAERQALEPANRVVEAAYRWAGQLNRSDALRRRRQQELAFHARDHLADADVKADTKADVALHPARNVEAVCQ
jgi:hypothetical protein